MEQLNLNNPIIQYYNEIAEIYDEDRFNNTYGQYIDSQERQILNKLFIKNKHEIVLDLACGSGRLLDYATIGIDGSQKMIEVAKQKYPDKDLYVADAERTELANSSVDTIIIFHFFMHLTQVKILNLKCPLE